MNEVDLYIELLDEITTDRTLKEWSKAISGISLESKKILLRKIINNLISSGKKDKSNVLNKIIEPQRIQGLEVFSENEFIRLMNDLVMFDIPDYCKFANAILYQKSMAMKLLPRFIENYKENKPIFNCDYIFQSGQEVSTYIMKLKCFHDDYLLKSPIKRNIYLSYKNHLGPVLVNVGEMSLYDFDKYVFSFKDENIIRLLQQEYIKTHPNDSLYSSNIINDYIDVDFLIKQYKHIGTIIEKVNRLQNHNKDLENDISNIRNELAQTYEKSDLLEKEYKILSDNKQRLEGQLNEYLRKIDDLSDQINEHERLEKEANLRNRKKITICEKGGKQGRYSQFLVIGVKDDFIIKHLFPEIPVISYSLWEISKESLLNDGIKYIYIHREGISTSEINSIESYAMEHDVDCHLFFTNTRKKYIEELVYLNKLIGGERIT